MGLRKGMVIIMKKIFILEELDCAHCAGKIEAEVRDAAGVISANLNFMAQKLVVELEDSFADSMEETVRKIVKKYEPDVAVIAK